MVVPPELQHFLKTAWLKVTDQLLRDAERRWHETRDIADEARFLTARVRAGHLNASHLELAAFCGHEGACRALATEALGPQLPLFVSLDRLVSWGRLPELAAIYGVAEAVRDFILRPPLSETALAEIHCAFEALRQYLLEPTVLRSWSLRRAANGLRPAIEGVGAITRALGCLCDELGHLRPGSESDVVWVVRAAAPVLGDARTQAAALATAARWALQPTGRSPSLAILVART